MLIWLWNVCVGFTNEYNRSPCSMCTGAILLYKIPRVVIGEHETFFGGEELLRKHGVEVVVKDDEECKEIMRTFVREKPEVRFRLSVIIGVESNFLVCRNGMRILDSSVRKILKRVTNNGEKARFSQNWLLSPCISTATTPSSLINDKHSNFNCLARISRQKAGRVAFDYVTHHRP